MAFCRAAREQYHFNGSDDPNAPDYVKPQVALIRQQRESSRQARAHLGAAMIKREKLPAVPLKATKPKYRKNTIAREAQQAEAELGGWQFEDIGAESCHPLKQFNKPAALKFSGRQRLDDGELAKITEIPYNVVESMMERRIAVNARQACAESNHGMGKQFFGGGGSKPRFDGC
eukprot:TRINITY_DN104421_c0_g1_i1.p1 TRINITY_DN104421_c0_g1~~TRINITY_DN104421_c0_g1_i1.p1  ORF type:complete len:174 (-),score=49.71 TRINITY_DN104421_c0_g1_i1:59-580(-)